MTKKEQQWYGAIIFGLCAFFISFAGGFLFFKTGGASDFVALLCAGIISVLCGIMAVWFCLISEN